METDKLTSIPNNSINYGNEMINLLLNRLIDLEARVKCLEEENKALKNQTKENIHFGQFLLIGPSGKANDDGFIMVISGINRNASITIDGKKVQYIDNRVKNGQGIVSCCSPISKGSSWSCQGEDIYFIPLLTN